MKNGYRTIWGRLLKWISSIYKEWRDVATTTGFDVILRAASAATGILTARILLPEGKGQLTAAILWPSLFQSIGSLGIKDAATYFTGKKEYSLGTLFGTLAVTTTAQGVIVGVVGWFTVPFLLSNYGPRAILSSKIILLSSPLFMVGGISMGMLQGMGKFDFWNSLRTLRRVMYLLLVVLLYIVSAASVVYVSSSYVIAAALATVVIPTYTLLQKIKVISISSEAFGQIMSYGLKNWLGSLTTRANSQADQALLSTFLAPQFLGWYKIAVSSSGLVNVVGTGFKRVIITSASQTGTAKSKRETVRFLKTASVPLALSAVTLIALLPFLVPFFFGQEYSNAVVASQILCIAVIFKSLKGILYNGVRGQGNPEWVFWGELCGLAATGLFLYLLLSPFGIEGAAVASLAAYATSLSVTLYLHESDSLVWSIADR